MAVINILKDGRIVEDLTGYVVSMKDCPQAYELLSRIKVPVKEDKKNERTV